jgi:hypothetical protein
MVVSKFGATSLADLPCWMPLKHLKSFDVWLGKLIRCEDDQKMIRLEPAAEFDVCWEINRNSRTVLGLYFGAYIMSLQSCETSLHQRKHNHCPYCH